MEESISARDMAELLGVSRTTAVRYANDPASHIRSHQDGRQRRYNRADAEAFAAARAQGRDTLTTNPTPNDDTPIEDATTDNVPLAASDTLGEATMLGGPKSLEDEAILDAPDARDPEAGDAPQAEQPAATEGDVMLPTLDETLEHEAASNPDLVLDEEILESLDLMEQDTSAIDSELALEDVLEGTDELDLVEAALLDEAPASDLEGDLVALVREQQGMLIAAERRIAELEVALSSRLSAEEEQALREEVTSYKTLLDSGGKAKKPKDDEDDEDEDDTDDKKEKKGKKDKKGKKKDKKDDD